MTTVAVDIIEQCVKEAASAADAARREFHRYPFFRSVTILLGDERATRLDAFSREISTRDLGLLHTIPIQPQPVLVLLPTDVGHIEMRTEIQWCEPRGAGWYLSGGMFSRLLPLKAMVLLCATALNEAQRRFRKRYPFLRPITVHRYRTHPASLAAFGRDISLDGIGLVHRGPIENGYATLSIPTSSGTADVTADIKWCRPCGGDLFLSGGRFVELQFGEITA
jgi:hypothetical protein